MQTSTILLIILAAIVALGLVLFQYHLKSKKRGKLFLLLSFLRFLTWLGAMLLLINPKFTKEEYTVEKTNLLVLIDNSSSMKDTDIAQTLQKFKERRNLSEKFNIKYHSFGNTLNMNDSISFSEGNTNIAKALKSVKTIYGADNSLVTILTDGNQTLGEDYEFYGKNQQLPIYPIVIGDTTAYEDFRIDQVNTNRYAFLKNRFPIEVYVSYQGNRPAPTTVTISVNGKAVFKENITFSSTLKTKIINTLLDANSVGLKNIQVSVAAIANEHNTQNNKRTVAVEVIDEKTNITIVSDIVHPDIGVLKKAIESNEQRAVSIQKSSANQNDWDQADLFILYQPKASFKRVYEYIQQKNANSFTIVGPKTDVNFLNGIQQTFNQQIFNYAEETTPNLNVGFSFFDVSDFSIEDFPPLDSNMGTINFKKPGETILNRRVKGVSLNEPMLQVTEEAGQREAILFGENLWKWRVQSYRNEKSFKNFDEFMGKLIRYLAVTKPRSRLSLDYKSVYEGANNAKIKATYFDKAFEFDGNAVIDLRLKNAENGKVDNYTMLLKNGYFEADLTNIPPGKYTFTAKVSNDNLTKSGSFTILDFDVEQQFLSSDYKKLERLANSSSGKSYFSDQTAVLADSLLASDRFLPIQKSEQNIVSLIDFRLLLALVAATLALEWFIRKYNGLT